jgi:hypothetical protein
MEQKSLDFEIQAERKGWKGEDVSDLRKGPTRTREDCALHQEKLITPLSDIWFPSFLAWIEPQERNLRNGTKKFGLGNSGREKQLKRWRCVRSEEGTDQDKGGLRPSPEKAHSSLVRYQIFEFFSWNRLKIEQTMKWNKKVCILKFRLRETAEKVKMCLIWGRDRPGQARTTPFTRKSS